MSKEYPCVYYDNGKCTKYSGDEAISFCVLGPCSDETPSNADRIRQMSDDELARHICCPHDQCIDLDSPCDKCVLSWLKEEAKT